MTAAPVGLYVHLPWCTRKCPYCDFNSYEARGELDEKTYVDALLNDFEDEVVRFGDFQVATIFFGGGTPSLFSGAAITRLLGGIKARSQFSPRIEITLEANPGSAEARRFSDYRQAGVNRLSIGVQSFNDRHLQRLGRVHSGAEANAAIACARAAGFDNFNLDLMFGLPGAAAGDALDDLACAISYRPAHISWYQLTLEAGTAFARNPPALPDHDTVCDDYDSGTSLLARAGYQHYEVSAYAQPDRAAAHNLNYWQFGDYIGIGAGAHGKLTVDGAVFRRSKIRHPERYMKASASSAPLASEERVPAATCLTDFMLNVLRLKRGFSLADLQAKTGLDATLPLVASPLAAALQRGWLERNGALICPTEAGFRFLNDLQMLFVVDEPAPSTPSGPRT